MKKITILLVDDHKVLRQGMRALLTTEPDLEVVGEAENGSQAVEMARTLIPDVVVMDIAMPQLNGLEATRQIMETAPHSKVLIMSSYSDDKFVLESTQAGAIGYILKQAGAPAFLKAVREARQGKVFFSPAISDRLFDIYHHALGNSVRRADDTPPAALSPRELEVLRRVAEGRSSLQVANELSIALNKVDEHLQSAMEKLDIHDVAGLTRYAVAEGIVEGTPVSSRID